MRHQIIYIRNAKHMKRISLYAGKPSWLTALHPLAKLFFICSIILMPLLSGRLWCFAVMICVSLLLLFHAGLLRRCLPLAAFSFTILATIFLIQSLFYHGNAHVLFSIGPLYFYQEGLLYALRIGLNILNMLLAFGLFVLSTRPEELVDCLEQAGFSPRFGYMLNSVFQIIPQMSTSMHTIMDAQRSRGLETDGSLLVRARAFLPLIGPVVSSALISTRERAIALEVRGFGSGMPKTFLHRHSLSRADRVLLLLSVLLLLLGLFLRFRVF